MNGGPLRYSSAREPQPLTNEEEAALAFAACGLTGYTLLELPFDSGDVPEAGGGNIASHLVARTAGSGDAMHPVVVFVLNDKGAWMLKRPQDFAFSEISELVRAAREGDLVELFEKSKVRISEERPAIPRETAYVPPFNKWSVSAPGSTYFLPVNELSAFYINLMLSALSEENAYFVVDERNRFQPAGIAKFARSRGGHLEDDPARNRTATVGFAETWLCEFAAIEQGSILQNLALMTQALGLGGFAHFAAHPYIWPQALGFRMKRVPFSRTIAAGRPMTQLLRLLKKDFPVPTAVGLERDGRALIKPFCPPYYRNMEEAVLAFVDYKFGKAGAAGSLNGDTAEKIWRDGRKVVEAIPRYSDRTIEAAIAYCEYIYRRYGRFPAISGPFRTILAHQAHHLDMDFYEKYYRPEALSETQRDHQAMWHAGS
jgi:hypothetical protein